MKFAFWGTPPLTTTILDELEKAGLTPVVIICGPDKKVGRGLTLTPPAPKLWALERNIPVLQPEKLDEAFFLLLTSYVLDLSVVVAYGKIIPEKIINLPKYGSVNVHYSLLPKWRGATPVESVILSGDVQTGVSIQQMVYALDAGDVLNETRIPLTGNEKTITLREHLNILAGPLLVKTIKQIETGEIAPQKQDESLSTHCGKMTKSDGEIDPNGDPIINDRKFRAYFGWPGTYFFVQRSDKKIRVIVKDAALENGKFIIKKVLTENGKEISYDEFVR